MALSGENCEDDSELSISIIPIYWADNVEDIQENNLIF